MKILGLIPARGGSKGVPGKNTKLLHGRPLLSYTADIALSNTRLARTVLSTDSEEIANVGRSCGLDVPFIRPPEYANDNSTALQTIQHALRELEGVGEKYDAVCYLQPTNPLRRGDHIDQCIDVISGSDFDCVFTIRSVPDHYNPHWTFTRDQSGKLAISTGEKDIIPNRQSLPAAFHRDGSVYVTKRDVIVNDNTLYGQNFQGVLLTDDYHVNIDTMVDWKKAERLMARLAAE